MSRRRSVRPPVPEQQQSQQEPPTRTVFVPITQMPHLADAARKSGHTARVLRVQIPEQRVETPNRRVGQWLGSGQPLKPVPQQYLSEAEIAEIEREPIAAPWEGGFDR